MIIRNGVEMPVEHAAKLDYDEGEAFFSKKRYRDASTRFRNIIDKMPTSTYADRAMWRQGQIYRAQKNVTGALKVWEALLIRYPTSPYGAQAKIDLSSIYFGQKDFPRVVEMLSSIPFKDVHPQRRPFVEKTIRMAFEKTATPMEKERLTWLISVLDAAPEVQNRKLRAEILESLDRIEDPQHLDRVFRERDNRFPASYACLKLARLSARAGDSSRAREWASLFLKRYPDHELHQEAASIIANLDRREDVEPTAVGVLLPFRGAKKSFSDQVLRGVAMALRVFESKGRLDGGGIRFVIEDVGETPEEAAAAVTRLVNDHKVMAAIGPLSLKESQGAATSASEIGLPIISMSSAEGIPEISPIMFRNNLTKSEQAISLAHLATDILGIRRAAVIYPQNNYGTEFMLLFWNEFVARGGEIRGAESYDSESGDLSAPVKRLVGLAPLELRSGEICSEQEAARRASLAEERGNVKPCYPKDKLPPILDFEAILVADGYEKATQIIPTLIYHDVRGVQVLGTNLLNSPEIFQRKTTDALQGTLFLDGFFKNRKTGPVPEFVQRFYATFGTEPGVLEALAYDTASIVMDVIQKNRPSSRSAFAEALKAVKDFPAVSGDTTFGPSREARRRLTPLVIDGEQIVELQ